jgi:parallel beta-helix repeat protein
MDGRALALGPMDGDAITPFSGNAVAGGEFLRNQRYGIEVLGGHGTSVQGAAIGKNSIGLVASEAATDVVVDGNTFTGPHEQAVSVRDGAAKITIRNNTVRGSATGIYNRNAQSIIERNTISEASVHGITVVGQAAGTVVTGNTISGRGPAALDMDRAVGLVAEKNVSDGWIVSRSLEAVLAGIFKPLTVVWMLVVLVVLVPIRVRLKSRSRGIVDPFEAQAPLSSVSRGIVDRQLIRR